jgi:SpoVK/Ycf46/Vps4 family AAA+-type ATPase
MTKAQRPAELREAFVTNDDEAWDDPDAIEAVFKELNAAEEAERARRDLCG